MQFLKEQDKKLEFIKDEPKSLQLEKDVLTKEQFSKLQLERFEFSKIVLVNEKWGRELLSILLFENLQFLNSIQLKPLILVFKEANV